MRSRLNVLMIGHTCSPLRGSEPGGVWNWAAHIAEYHRVSLICHPQYRREFESLPDAVRPKDLELHWTSLPRAIDPWDCSRSERGLRLHYLLWLRAALRVAKALHASRRFDLVHQVGLGTVSAPSPFWRLGAPLIWGPIGGGQLAPSAFREYFGRAWISEWLRSRRVTALKYSLALRRSVERSAVIVVTNQATMDIVKGLGAKDVRYLLDSGTPSFWMRAEQPVARAGARCVFIWWGRLEAHKGLPIALEALSQAQDRSLRLLVAGSGPMRCEWEALARQLSLVDRVHFLGQVPRDRLRDLASQCDAFVFTSLRESFGSTVLEAMAAGLPVIALDHHGVAQFLSNDAGFKAPVTTPAETVSALAAAMDRFSSLDPAMRARIARAAWRQAQAHTWPVRASKMLEWYDTVNATTVNRSAADSLQQARSAP